ncbi:MAG TPA: GNAT family N-acetyltransferase [Rhizomicrobium sp.]|nr:GNAT family N-acetyltransferase [Rhizomicrobium sp.]
MSKFEIKEATTDAEIRHVYPVMRELRTHIKTVDEFLERVRRQQKGSGWRLITVEDNGVPVAAAGFRVSEWLAWGRALYVDDLICLESHRGKGFAEALMIWMEDLARAEGCGEFHLDSGTHRLGAHRFYHRLKLAITSFHFQKKV